jgi:hypothetical protein
MPGLLALNWRFSHLPVFHGDEARPGMRVNTAFHSMGITHG